MTLVEFLTARLDEDAEALKALPAARRVYMDNDGCISEPIDTWADGDDRLPNHHNNWYLVHDAARVVREVEAKRAILASHQWHVDTADRDFAYTRTGEANLAERQVRVLAAVYSDHPDYDPSWRP